MIQEGVAEYLGVGENSAVYFEFNASSLIEYINNQTQPSSQPHAAFLSTLFDYILHGDRSSENAVIPPIDPRLFESVKVPYRVAGTYDLPNGKFSSAYGNVALIDCNYLLDNAV
jgi:hypothetical protein